MRTGARGPRLTLLVFDLDGTLADTEADLADAVNELRTRLGFGRLSRPRIAAGVGQGVGHLLKMTVPAVPDALRVKHPDVYREFQKIYLRRCTRKTRLYPGIREALRALPRGLILAVATNKPGGMSRKILRKLGVLHRFRAVVGGDEMRIRKPHPAVMIDLMKRFRATPSTTVLVGDSRFDMETAKRARVRSVACGWGFGSRAELARYRPTASVGRSQNLRSALETLLA